MHYRPSVRIRRAVQSCSTQEEEAEVTESRADQALKSQCLLAHRSALKKAIVYELERNHTQMANGPIRRPVLRSRPRRKAPNSAGSRAPPLHAAVTPVTTARLCSGHVNAWGWGKGGTVPHI